MGCGFINFSRKGKNERTVADITGSSKLHEDQLLPRSQDLAKLGKHGRQSLPAGGKEDPVRHTPD